MMNLSAQPTSRCYMCGEPCPKGWMSWSLEGPAIVCSKECDAEVVYGRTVKDGLKQAEEDRQNGRP
jgi:hypothetical protein